MANESLLERDLTTFQDFKARWADGTLSKDHPVVAKTSHWARAISFKYGCPERGDDLKQEALMQLATSSYKGEAGLNTYILTIVERLNIAEWKRAGGKRREELPEEVVDEANLELLDRVLQRLEEDELLASLLATRSELRRTVVKIILRAEKQVSRRRLAELASQELGHKITRHEVEIVLKQLSTALRSMNDEAVKEREQRISHLRAETHMLMEQIRAELHVEENL
ncbi:MAG: hypothetical protein QOE46_1247 [Acidobacteriota bacterium]|jgi:DNA-directed RNA polymerase specialized sigma24 family protein|nr:hypothetical protein [Acidobacteriota bacterium]